MELKFEAWCKQLLELAEKFNKAKNHQERVAYLTAIEHSLRTEADGMKNEMARFSKLMVSEILKRPVS